jgi:hypothetical protein
LLPQAGCPIHTDGLIVGMGGMTASTTRNIHRPGPEGPDFSQAINAARNACFLAAAGRSGAQRNDRIAFLDTATNPTCQLNYSPMRSLGRYLNELIDYGDIPATHAEVILDMQRAGHPQPVIDRWLQGQEYAATLRARQNPITIRIFLTTP